MIKNERLSSEVRGKHTQKKTTNAVFKNDHL